MLDPTSHFVIWGLNDVRHSHRYIHQGFYQTLARMGHKVDWVSDSTRNRKIVEDGSIVIACGVAAEHLPMRLTARYVLHNFDSESHLSLNHIKLQVLTNDSQGVSVDDSHAKWDKARNTLYQPWGLPEPKEYWLSASQAKSSRENWIGAIWDNEQHQGNSLQIAEYKASLEEHGLSFKRLGGTRSFSKNGLTSQKAFDYVNTSPIGAAILGKWQKDNGYVPCRAFKNIASGAVPISNSNLIRIFGDAYLYSDSIVELVEIALNLNTAEIAARSESCKEVLPLYPYEASLERILSVLP